MEQHWDTGKSHNKDPEWLKEVRPEKEWKKKDDIQTTTEMVIQQTKKDSNWKFPGPVESKVIG